MTSLSNIITAKVAAAGLTGVLVVGGIGVAAAQDRAPEASGESDSSLAIEVDDVPTGDLELPGGLEGLVEIPEVAGAPIPALPETGVQEVDDLLAELEEGLPGAPVGDVVDDDDSDEGVSGPPQDSFGARVSADARGESDGQPGVDGRQIAAEARAMGEARRAANGDDVDDDVDDAGDEAEDVDDDDEADDENEGASAAAQAGGGARGR